MMSHRLRLSLLSIPILLLPGILQLGVPVTATAASGDRPAIQRVRLVDRILVKHINQARTKRGLHAVIRSSDVSRTARPWARRLADPLMANRLAHDPGYFADIQRSCSGARGGAENVAYRQGRLQTDRKWTLRHAGRRLFRSYMASPGHRANILRPEATHVGSMSMLRGSRGSLAYVSNVTRFASAQSC